MNRPILGAAAFAALAFLATTGIAHAHGFAGDRFFPATLATDDPFVADEMSLPTLTRNPTGSDSTQETDIDIDLAKRLTRDLGVTFSDQWKYIQPKGQAPSYGFDAVNTGLQYQLFIDGPHEAMALAGVNVGWGHTGRVNGAGAPDFTTVSPELDFGKGFGDLPDGVPWLRPFAVTGNLSLDFPTKTESAGTQNPNVLNYGVAIEYSLEYLEHHVREVGLKTPFDRLIPLVELTMSTPVNRGQGSQTTGTVQPGFIWAGQYYQIGVEAIVPINGLSGRGIGGLLQFHLFLDDLFPNSIGKPLFGS